MSVDSRRFEFGSAIADGNCCNLTTATAQSALHCTTEVFSLQKSAFHWKTSIQLKSCSCLTMETILDGETFFNCPHLTRHFADCILIKRTSTIEAELIEPFLLRLCLVYRWQQHWTHLSSIKQLLYLRVLKKPSHLHVLLSVTQIEFLENCDNQFCEKQEKRRINKKR